jgi:two-component system, NarL family, nitrate/nitrite response regulator NarL
VRPIRCLIVDDNESFLRAAEVLLERQGLPVVGVALTSSEARRLVKALQPDLVLVDISLGDESGIDLAAQLAQDGLPEGAAVILISTRAYEEVAELIAQTSAAGFLPKEDLSADAIRGLLDGDTG